LPSLIDDIVSPEEEEYCVQIVRYLDSVFHECLNKKAEKSVRKKRKPIDPVEGMIYDTEAFSAAFDNEFNYIIYYY